MSGRKSVTLWLSLISGIFMLTATAEELAAPVDGKYSANEIANDHIDLTGKVVKVKFNRMYSARKLKDGLYTGNLRSSVKPQGDSYRDSPGIQIQFSQEGLGYFSKFIAKAGGSSDENLAAMTMSDGGEVYVQISSEAKAGFMAAGDQYKKDGDDGKYRWSVETKIPDLKAQRRVSVSDVLLFPEQLNGETVELLFYEADQIKQKSPEEFSTNISAGRGHATVPAKFPAEGRSFFKEIIERNSDPKPNSIYAAVTLNSNGTVFLEAKGRRTSGSDYRW